jgi:rhomboid family protein
MLLPIGDDNRDRKTTPLVNYFLIIVNILVFVFLQDIGSNEKFTNSFSLVPEEIATGKDIVTDGGVYTDPQSGEKVRVMGLQPTPISVYITFFTSIFMHGGIAHLLGNMLFLFIFGDNVEDRLGHFRYFIFYLIVGVLASVSHIIVTSMFGGNMLIPVLGASGAISGVLAAYLVLYPRKRVRVLVFYFLTEVPAILVIGLWFVFQLMSGIGMFGSNIESGVAYGAHVGGFIAGLILVGFFLIGRKKSN